MLKARQAEREDLERAAEIERALSPQTLPSVPGWSFGAVSAPARHVGGDFFDLRLRVPEVIVTLGDVMGKGVGAGMLAAAARAALRAQRVGEGPARMVHGAASTIGDDLARSGAFITLSFGVVNLLTGDVRLVDAGHGLHFIARADGTVERLNSLDMPLGLATEWTEINATLAPGDALVIVSDGLLELCEDSMDGLQDALARCAADHAGSAQELVDALCEGAEGEIDRDDVTALTLLREAPERGLG